LTCSAEREICCIVVTTVAISEPQVVSRTVPWEDRASHGLVSLFQMLRVHAEHYVAIGKVLHSLSRTYGDQQGILTIPQQSVTEGSRELIVDQLGIIKSHCDQLELAVCTEFLETYQTSFKKEIPTRGEVAQFVRAFEVAFTAELKKQLFVFVYPEKAHTFEQEMLFGPEVDRAFPSAKDEIVDAGTSFALGLNTACVFHCMRILERGLWALASCFELSFTLEQWHNIIEQIESKIEALKSLPKSSQKLDDLEFYAKAATHFMFFKDAWRNHVMHGRRSYTDREAFRVLDHTEDFMRHLCTRLHEQPTSLLIPQ